MSLADENHNLTPPRTNHTRKLAGHEELVVRGPTMTPGSTVRDQPALRP